MGSLSKLQTSIVTGCMLGDGYMRCKTNAHLQITHSIKQKSYVDWKYNALEEFVLTKPKPYKGNGTRIGYRFFTRSLPLFTDFYRKYYPNKIKVIPKELVLNNIIMAVWYMDDGSKCGSCCYLNTQQFTLPEQKYLVSVIMRDLNLEAKIDRDKQYYRIRFPVSSSKKLTKLLSPHIIPTIKYKL